MLFVKGGNQREYSIHMKDVCLFIHNIQISDKCFE